MVVLVFSSIGCIVMGPRLLQFNNWNNLLAVHILRSGQKGLKISLSCPVLESGHLRAHYTPAVIPAGHTLYSITSLSHPTSDSNITAAQWMPPCWFIYLSKVWPLRTLGLRHGRPRVPKGYCYHIFDIVLHVQQTSKRTKSLWYTAIKLYAGMSVNRYVSAWGFQPQLACLLLQGRTRPDNSERSLV